MVSSYINNMKVLIGAKILPPRHVSVAYAWEWKGKKKQLDEYIAIVHNVT